MAFLGIRVPHEVGRLIRNLEVPGEKETPSEYNITLLVFEDNWSIKKMLKATEAAYEIMAETEPFSVKADHVSHFPPRPDHPVPIIAPVKSEELHQLHKKLVKALQAAKVDFKQTFKEYKPHITLAYSPHGYDDYKMDTPLQFMVQEAVLWGGDEGDTKLFTTLPIESAREKEARSAVESDRSI